LSDPATIQAVVQQFDGLVNRLDETLSALATREGDRQ